MNLKKRLIVTNTSIVLIPLLLTALIGSFSLFLYTRITNSKIDYKNTESIASIRYEIFSNATMIWGEKPENLAKNEFTQYISARLGKLDAKVIVFADKTPIYSPIVLNNIDIEKILDPKSSSLTGNSIVISNVSYLVHSNPFVMKDDRQGNIVILTPVNQNDFATEKFLVFVLLVFIVSFLLTNIINSNKLSKSIVKPLQQLNKAVDEISSGNLSYTVLEEGDEEIRQVSEALEAMRLKLDESVSTQKKYDDNRKMLVSSISHDLKTPITSIKGYVEGILDGVPQTPEQTEKYLKTIYSKTVQVDNMIDDLLLYSKLDLNQLAFNFQLTDVLEYFKDCVEENEPELSKESIKISLINLLSNNYFVLIDRQKMKRAVMNILDNARKYIKKDKGEIKVILREITDRVIIEIADNGIGISKDNLSLIFDRFYRTDSARNTAGGSGMGLAIARQIIEGQDGQVWVTSQESKGTQFMISLKKSNARSGEK